MNHVDVDLSDITMAMFGNNGSNDDESDDEGLNNPAGEPDMEGSDQIYNEHLTQLFRGSDYVTHSDQT